MTRINVVPVETLHNKHLAGEFHEVTRVFGLARKAQFDILKGKRKLPKEYVLGKGHVEFYYDKLGYIIKRYEALSEEMRKRGYNTNQIDSAELVKGIDKRLLGDYTPTPEAIQINRQRIAERMPK